MSPYRDDDERQQELALADARRIDELTRERDRFKTALCEIATGAADPATVAADALEGRS